MLVGVAVVGSVVEQLRMSLEDALNDLADDGFEGGGVSVYGLKEDGVGLGKISPKYTDQENLDLVDAERQKIIDGETTVPENVQ